MKVELHGGSMMSIRMLLAALYWLKSQRRECSIALGFSGPEHLDLRIRESGIYHLHGKLDNGFVFDCECAVGGGRAEAVPAHITLDLYEEGQMLEAGPLLQIVCSEFALVEMTTGDKELILFRVRSTPRS